MVAHRIQLSCWCITPTRRHHRADMNMSMLSMYIDTLTICEDLSLLMQTPKSYTDTVYSLLCACH